MIVLVNCEYGREGSFAAHDFTATGSTIISRDNLVQTGPGNAGSSPTHDTSIINV